MRTRAGRLAAAAVGLIVLVTLVAIAALYPREEPETSVHPHSA